MKSGWGRKNKFGAVRVGNFPSKLEAAVWQMLRIMEAAGEISDIKRQQTIVLTEAKIRWKVDFTYTNLKTGEMELAEAKGVSGERFRIILDLYRVYGTSVLNLWKGTYTKPYIAETIKPRGMK